MSVLIIPVMIYFLLKFQYLTCLYVTVLSFSIMIYFVLSLKIQVFYI